MTKNGLWELINGPKEKKKKKKKANGAGEDPPSDPRPVPQFKKGYSSADAMFSTLEKDDKITKGIENIHLADTAGVFDRDFYSARTLAAFRHRANFGAAEAEVKQVIENATTKYIEKVKKVWGDDCEIRLVHDHENCRPTAKQGTTLKREKKEILHRFRLQQYKKAASESEHYNIKKLKFPRLEQASFAQFPGVQIVTAPHEADPYISRLAREYRGGRGQATPRTSDKAHTWGSDGDLVVGARADTSLNHFRCSMRGKAEIINRSLLEQEEWWSGYVSLEAQLMACAMAGDDYSKGIYNIGLKTIAKLPALVDFCNRPWVADFEGCETDEDRTALSNKFREALKSACAVAKRLGPDDSAKARSDDLVEEKARASRTRCSPTPAQQKVRQFERFTLSHVVNAIKTGRGDDDVPTGTKSEWIKEAVEQRKTQSEDARHNILYCYGPPPAGCRPAQSRDDTHAGPMDVHGVRDDDERMTADEGSVESAAREVVAGIDAAGDADAMPAEPPRSPPTAHVDMEAAARHDAKLKAAKEEQQQLNATRETRGGPRFDFKFQVVVPRSDVGMYRDTCTLAQRLNDNPDTVSTLDNAREVKQKARAEVKQARDAVEGTAAAGPAARQRGAKQMRAQSAAEEKDGGVTGGTKGKRTKTGGDGAKGRGQNADSFKHRAHQFTISVPNDQAARNLVVESLGPSSEETQPRRAIIDILELNLAELGLEFDFLTPVVDKIIAHALAVSPIHPIAIELFKDQHRHNPWRQMFHAIIKYIRSRQAGKAQAGASVHTRPSRRTKEEHLERVIRKELGIHQSSPDSDDADLTMAPADSVPRLTQGNIERIKKSDMWWQLTAMFTRYNADELDAMYKAELPPFAINIIEEHLGAHQVRLPETRIDLYDNAIDGIARNYLLAARVKSLGHVKALGTYLSHGTMTRFETFTQELCKALHIEPRPQQTPPSTNVQQVFADLVAGDLHSNRADRLASIIAESLETMPLANADAKVPRAESEDPLDAEEVSEAGEEGETNAADAEGTASPESPDTMPMTEMEAWTKRTIRQLYSFLHRAASAVPGPPPAKKARRVAKPNAGELLRSRRVLAPTAAGAPSEVWIEYVGPAEGNNAAQAAAFVVEGLLDLRETLMAHLDAVALHAWPKGEGVETMRRWWEGKAIGRTGLELGLAGPGWATIREEELPKISQRMSSFQFDHSQIRSLISDAPRTQAAYLANVNLIIDRLNNDLNPAALDALATSPTRLRPEKMHSHDSYGNMCERRPNKLLPEALYSTKATKIDRADPRALPGLIANEECIDRMRALATVLKDQSKKKKAMTVGDWDQAAVGALDLLFRLPSVDRYLPQGFVTFTASCTSFLMVDVSKLKGADEAEQMQSPLDNLNGLLRAAMTTGKAKTMAEKEAGKALHLWCMPGPTLELVKFVEKAGLREQVGHRGTIKATKKNGHRTLTPDTSRHEEIRFAIGRASPAGNTVECRTTSSHVTKGGVQSIGVKGRDAPAAREIENEAVRVSTRATVEAARDGRQPRAQAPSGQPHALHGDAPPAEASVTASAPPVASAPPAADARRADAGDVPKGASTASKPVRTDEGDRIAEPQPAASPVLAPSKVWIAGVDAGEQNVTEMALFSSNGENIYRFEIKGKQFNTHDENNRVKLADAAARSATLQLLEVTEQVPANSTDAYEHYSPHALLERLEARNPRRLAMLRAQRGERNKMLEQLARSVRELVLRIAAPAGTAAPHLVVFVGQPLKGRSQYATGANRTNSITNVLIEELGRLPQQMTVDCVRVNEYMTSQTCPNMACRFGRMGDADETGNKQASLGESMGYLTDRFYDYTKLRLLQCEHCRRVYNRDVVGAVNIALVGLFGALVNLGSSSVHLFSEPVEQLLGLPPRKHKRGKTGKTAGPATSEGGMASGAASAVKDKDKGKGKERAE